MLPPSQVENDGMADPSAPAASTGVLIIPPADMKRSVDGVARVVASLKSPWYEESMSKKDALVREYPFLSGEDPYHAYYRHRVSELRVQNGWSADGNEKAAGEFADYCKRIKNAPGMPSVSERGRKALEWYEKGRAKYDEQKENRLPKLRGTQGQPGTKRQQLDDSLVVPEDQFLAQHQVCKIAAFRITFDEQKENLLPKLRGTQGQPETKRQQLDDSLVVPEDQFLAEHQGPVCVGARQRADAENKCGVVFRECKQFEREDCWRD